MAEIIAHRGASYDAPENTLAALRLAWRQHAGASEFDVRLTRDGRIVAMHDPDTRRTAGVAGKVADRTLAELKKLDVGRWKGAAFAGEKIPTLAELLAATPAGKRVLIEVKCGPEIVPELGRVLKASKRKSGRTAVLSFRASVIAAVKEAFPEVPANWLVSLTERRKKPVTAEGLIARAKRLGADGLGLEAAKSLDEAFAKAVKAAGLRLDVWTVNDAEQARRLARLGVDGITTDRPGWLREQLSR
jgi:glycerophosphoryl diester phosphodiesterase